MEEMRDSQRAPFYLLRVCKDWTVIAIRHSSLWRYLTFDFARPAQVTPKILRLLQTRLCYLGTEGKIDICINSAKNAIINRIADYVPAERLLGLELHGHRSDWIKKGMFHVQSTFTNLERLCLDLRSWVPSNTDSQLDVIERFASPRIRELVLRGWNLEPKALLLNLASLEQLQHLELTSAIAGISCTYETPVTLASLSSLKLDNLCPQILQFMTHVQTPNIRHLTVQMCNSTRAERIKVLSTAFIADFITRIDDRLILSTDELVETSGWGQRAATTITHPVTQVTLGPLVLRVVHEEDVEAAEQGLVMVELLEALDVREVKELAVNYVALAKSEWRKIFMEMKSLDRVTFWCSPNAEGVAAFLNVLPGRQVALGQVEVAVDECKAKMRDADFYKLKKLYREQEAQKEEGAGWRAWVWS
uniref:F-box domain-containing protein n=1 Tax=Mycena chlorophos TaxID=658473 RepID=A0ABQ0LB28_MYCCL|nr:predicted protein [Mycena chlorophos]